MKTKIFTLVLSMAGCLSSLYAQCSINNDPNSINFSCSTPGNYEFTPTVTFTAKLQLWGGGGGGGTGNGAREGGGGGGFAEMTNYTFTAGVNYCVRIGTGGSVGINGQSSILYTGGCGGATVAQAQGGGLGTGNGGVGSSGLTSTGDITYEGGNGANKDGNVGGGGGGSALPTANGGNAIGITRGTGSGNGGNGGANGASGMNGSTPGGGGGGRGGGGTTPVSGTGGAGRAILTGVSVLPVELLSFSGKATPSAIELNWETSTELNNEKFIIERSTDGRTFQVIGEELGQGTTQQTVSYQFMDQAPVAGLNYYRLKQMDYDGQFAYSPVTAITFTRKGGISVYPTATNGMLNIVTEDEGNALVKVFHINGSLMRQQTFAGNTLPLDLSSLPNGTYLIVVETSTQTHQERIFKL